MKKIWIVSLLLLLTGCTTEPTIIEKEVPRDLTYTEMKEVTDEIEADLQAEYDEKLQAAIDKLEPVVEVVYKDGVEYVTKTVEVPRELTAAELKEITDKLKEESDVALQYAIDHLEPVEKIVYQDKIVVEYKTITNDDYKKRFDTCVVTREDGTVLNLVNGEIAFTLTGTVTGGYTINLDEPVDGVSQYKFSTSTEDAVCTFALHKITEAVTG